MFSNLANLSSKLCFSLLLVRVPNRNGTHDLANTGWALYPLSVLILAVCRLPVAYELSKMILLSMSSYSSVDRTLPSVQDVIGVILVGDSDFLCPTLVSCWSMYLSHSIAKLKIHHLFWVIIMRVLLSDILMCINSSWPCGKQSIKCKNLFTQCCLNPNCYPLPLPPCASSPLHHHIISFTDVMILSLNAQGKMV